MPLVVERKKVDGRTEILAVGRLSKLHGRNEAELAALVSDGAQHLGLGSELYRRMLQVARDEKIAVVSSNMLAENHEMRGICKRLGFKMQSGVEDNTMHAELAL